MNIRCDFCGASYDNEKHSHCPNCHSVVNNIQTTQTYNNQDPQSYQNDIYSQMEKDRMNTEQEYLESQRLRKRISNENRNANAKAMGCLVPLIIFFIFFAILVVSTAVSVFKEEGFFNDNSSTETEIVEVEQNVNFNETASLSNYSILCDKFETVDPAPWTINENEDCIEAHFIIQNTKDEALFFDEEIDCIADGTRCPRFTVLPTEVKNKNDKITPLYLNANDEADGSVCFKVPKDANKIIIKIGKYINIKIK